MKYLADCNILLDLAFDSRLRHLRTTNFLLGLPKIQLGICPIVESCFLLYAGLPASKNGYGLPYAQAWQTLQTIKKARMYDAVFVPDDIPFPLVASETITRKHSSVIDQYLVSLARKHNCHLLSADGHIKAANITNIT